MAVEQLSYTFTTIAINLFDNCHAGLWQLPKI